MEIVFQILIWYSIVAFAIGLFLALLFGEIKHFLSLLVDILLFPFYLGYWLLAEICLKGPVSKTLLYLIESIYLGCKSKRIRMSIDKAKLRVTAIDRLRIDTDGKGVTTLVVLNKCPLNCKYCPNPKARTLRNRVELTSPERLCRHLKEDDLYFRASGGGVTFGGGEPLLQADKIKEFKKLCPPEWKINIETSLNVDLSLIKEVADVVDHWMIDIKDMNQKIYKAYTGKSNRKVVKNLKWMAENGLANKMEILIPLIPEYNTLEDIENNKRKLNEIGLTNHNVFSYIITHNERKSPTLRGIPFNKNVRTSK